jgi:hypothetical protein
MVMLTAISQMVSVLIVLPGMPMTANRSHQHRRSGLEPA